MKQNIYIFSKLKINPCFPASLHKGKGMCLNALAGTQIITYTINTGAEKHKHHGPKNNSPFFPKE